MLSTWAGRGASEGRTAQNAASKDSTSNNTTSNRTNSSRTTSNALWHVGALLLYALLTLALTWPLARHFTSAIPGDGFDGWQNYWNLWWLREALIERLQSPLTTDLLYYPTGVSLYFHTLNPFNGMLSMPVQLSAGLLVAYNFVVLFSFVLSGYGAYLLALWLMRPKAGAPVLSPTARRLGALLGGAIFTFAPFHFAHLLGHMQVFAYQWLPFTVLYILRALAASTAGRRWWRAALLGGFFFALAGFCDWYFVLYLALFTGLAFLWTWARSARALGVGRALAAALLPCAVVALVAFALLAPMLAPMVIEAVQYSFMVRPTSDLYILSAAAMDFLLPSRMHTFATPEIFSTIGNQIAPVSESTIAIGWVALLLALAGVVRDWRRALPWLLAAFCFALLAMGPRLHLWTITWTDIPQAGAAGAEWSPYAILNRLVPFMRISRSVSRFALMVQLSIAMAAALGFAALLARRSARTMALLSIGALVLVIAEYSPAPYPLSPPDTPAYYTTLRAAPVDAARPALLNLPMNYDRPGYLLYQTVHARPLAVAYISRDDPRTLTERAPLLQHLRHLGDDILALDAAAVGKTVLGDLGVGIVTLDRYKMPGGLEREYTEALANALFAGDAPLYADERLTAYAVEPPATPTPYILLGAENWGALQRDAEGAVIGRALGAEAAQIEVRHAPANRALTITYQSDMPIEVRDPLSNEAITRLPAASQPTLATIALHEHATIALFAPGALIQSVGLLAE